jgi:hypothetical protein
LWGSIYIGIGIVSILARSFLDFGYQFDQSSISYTVILAMLLRIQVYPADGSNELAARETPSLAAASTTHFASLSTSLSVEYPGRIWSLGRKQGCCTIADKSVSREHVVLSVASSNPSFLVDNDKDRPTAAQPCNTPDQVEACRSASDQMCVVLRNIGKLGSYLVLGEDTTVKSASARAGSAKDDDDDDDDSDTADEEEIVKSQQSQAAAAAVLDVQISDIAKYLVLTQQGYSSVRLKMIGADETIVLDTLSERNESSSQRPMHVVVQCGKLGTTIALQRVQFRLVVSSDAKKAVAPLEPFFYMVGCSIEANLLTDQEDDDSEPFGEDETLERALSMRASITLLVTELCAAKPKHLTAWSRGIPVVTPLFVEALCRGRKSPADPLPYVKQYTPKYDQRDFWTKRANPKLWSSCTFLSVKNDEYESLVRAAGARIVRLYVVIAGDNISVMDEETIQNTIENITSSTNLSACFALDNRLNATKILKRIGVALVTAKQLALAITQQEIPTSSMRSTIGDSISSTSAVAEVTMDVIDRKSYDDDAPCKRKHKDTQEASLQQEQSDTNMDATPIKKSRTVRATKASGGAPVHEDSIAMLEAYEDGIDKPSAEEVKAPPSSSRRRTARTTPKRADESAVKKGSKSSTLKPQAAGSPATEASSRAMGSPITDTALPLSVRARENRALDTGKDQLASIPENRKRTTPVKSGDIGGWLATLPQGKKRLEYRRSNDEIQEITGQEKFYRAETVRCKIPKAPNVGTNQPSSRSAYDGPNFKTFRKNQVPSQPSFMVPVYNTVARESDARRNLEKQREENETQQRRVDALFGG